MSKQYFEKLNTEKLTELKKVELAKIKKIHLSVVDDAKSLADTLVERKRSLEGFTDCPIYS